MPGKHKPISYYAKMLATDGNLLDRSTRLRAKRIVAGVCIQCGVAVENEVRHCRKCEPPRADSSLVSRTCQNPNCPRPDKKFKGRQHSKGCSPQCRQAVYRLTVREAKPKAEVVLSPDLKALAETAYQRWLAAQIKRLSDDGLRDWTEAMVLGWAETDKVNWIKGWIEVYICEQGERAMESPAPTGWEGWQPSVCWNTAGGGSD